MTHNVAFKAALSQVEGFGVSVKDRRLHDWLAPSSAASSGSANAFLEPLEFKPVFPASLGAASVAQSNQADRTAVRKSETIAEGDAVAARLFDARANAKMAAAQVSMHLKPEWRAKINRQVDRLLDLEQWDEGDGLLDVESVKSFLRFVIYAEVSTVPSLGMAPTGAILAGWRADTRRLTVEFRGKDYCRLSISHFNGDDTSIITFAGSTVQARTFLERVGFPIG